MDTRALMETAVAFNETIVRDDLNLIQEDMPESDDQTIEADSSEEEKSEAPLTKQASMTFEEDYEVPKFLWYWESIVNW